MQSLVFWKSEKINQVYAYYKNRHVNGVWKLVFPVN